MISVFCFALVFTNDFIIVSPIESETPFHVFDARNWSTSYRCRAHSNRNDVDCMGASTTWFEYLMNTVLFDWCALVKFIQKLGREKKTNCHKQIVLDLHSEHTALHLNTQMRRMIDLRRMLCRCINTCLFWRWHFFFIYSIDLHVFCRCASSNDTNNSISLTQTKRSCIEIVNLCTFHPCNLRTDTIRCIKMEMETHCLAHWSKVFKLQ